DAQKRAEDLDRAPLLLADVLEANVLGFWRGAAVVARDQRDHVDLFGLEAAQVAVLDQVIRMAMVLFVADVVADVVQVARILEPLALAIAELVNALGLIEQRQRDRR